MINLNLINELNQTIKKSTQKLKVRINLHEIIPTREREWLC